MQKKIRSVDERSIQCNTLASAECELSVDHGDSGLRLRRSYLSRGLSGPAPGRSRGWRSPAFDFFFERCPGNELRGSVSYPVFFFFHRFYSCTRVLQSWRWLFLLCFLRSNDRTKTGVCLLSFLLRSLRLTKTVLKPKKKAMQALSPPQWRAPRIWVLQKWKTKIVGRPTASIGRSPLSTPKDHRHANAWIEREGHFPCPAHGTGLWQTFKSQLSFQSRTSKPDDTWTPTSTAWEILPTRCKQSSISFSKDKRRCEKLKKAFLFAFGHSLSFPSILLFLFFFSRFTVALSNSKQTWPGARKNWKSPDVQKLALVPPLARLVPPLARLVPPLAQVGFADLLLFVTLPIIFLERSFCTKTKLEDLAFQNTRQNVRFPTETICRILYSNRSRALR